MRMADYMETISAVSIPMRAAGKMSDKDMHDPGYSGGIPAEIQAAVSSRLAEKRLTASSI
jgi:hypothetical protein